MEMPKSKYPTHIEPNLKLITSWREAGKTEEQIAEKLKVACSTLREHKNMYPALMAALSTSKEKLVANLKKSLWEEALGYEYKRIDKEAMKEIEDKIAEDRRQAQSYTDEAIRRAYNSLYEDVTKTIKEKKAAADNDST